MIDLIASEWWKLRTVRSTQYVLGAAAGAVVLAALISWNAVATWDRLDAEQRSHFALAPLEGLASWVGYLCLATFGVLTMTSEYATGTISATLIAAPRRRAVFAAKAAIVAAIALFLGLAVAFGTVAVSQWIIDGRPIGASMLQARDEFALLGAMGLSMMMFALLGLGVGAITRSTGGSIGIVVVLWYLLPMGAQDFPPPWDGLIGSLAPGALAGQLAGTGNNHSVYAAELSPVSALVAMTAYSVLPLAMAAVLFYRRDV